MKISVVLPVYNSSRHLEEAINSILAQTYRDFELLIIDDGSTDNSVELIQQYTDPRIRLLRNKHDFIDSLNIGINNALGEYIARMDADDIMYPNRLEIQLQVMEMNPDVAVCSSWMKVFGDAESDCHSYRGYIPYPLLQLLRGNIVSHPTVMIRKSFLQKHHLQYEHYPYAEDYKLWTKIAQCGGHFWVVPIYLLKYRTSSDQVSLRNTDEQQETSLQIKNEILNYLLINNKYEKDEVDKLFETLEVLNENSLISEKVCFDLFFDLFYNIENKIAQKNSNDIEARSPFLGNYFCTIENKNMAFIAIAKVCVTFLKQLAIYYRTGQIVNLPDIHYIVGFTSESDYLIPISEMKKYEQDKGKLLKFAVWKDPVKRLVSAYKFFCLEMEPRTYFKFLGFANETITFDRFLDFVEFELSKNDVEFQDEHIRAQSSYYKKEDVDIIIPDYKLNAFLEEHGVDLIVDRINETKVNFSISKEQEERIKQLYKADYEQIKPYVSNIYE